MSFGSTPRATGRLLVLWIAALWMLAPLGARAHEIRPSYLEIRENADHTVHVLWKQPVTGNLALALRPALSSGWLDRDPVSTSHTSTYLIRRWTVPPPHQAMEGQQLTIEGLERTMTDALVRIVHANGIENTKLLKPQQASLLISAAAKAAPPVADYLQLGVMHIWTGLDHLLYVLGLLLLVKRRVDLVKTITAFTVAHSITLAAASLHLVNVSTAPIEALIALSIVYVAVELVNMRRGRAGLAQRFPWAVAFAFGLLHGFGFAGALNEVGLPAHDIPLALLFFNVGIELGQLAFVALVLTTMRPVLQFAPRFASFSARLTPHVIGAVAAFWLIERTSLLVGAAS